MIVRSGLEHLVKGNHPPEPGAAGFSPRCLDVVVHVPGSCRGRWYSPYSSEYYLPDTIHHIQFKGLLTTGTV